MKTFHLIVRSRNTSCKQLRELITPYWVIYRMGSTTPTNLILKKRKQNSKINLVEINPTESCRISGDKILMKTRFTRGHIPTAEWRIGTDNYQVLNHLLNTWKTIIIKHKHSSGGNGIYLAKSIDDFNEFFKNKQYDVNEYIYERYYTYTKEYRIHVTKDGCFLSDRKMLKNDSDVRWHRHANNSVWISENNELFDRPSNWDEICASCVNALKSIGLDIAAFDVKVQNNKHENPKWIILESNSAPSLGEKSILKYKEILNNIIYGK